MGTDAELNWDINASFSTTHKTVLKVPEPLRRPLIRHLLGCTIANLHGNRIHYQTHTVIAGTHGQVLVRFKYSWACHVGLYNTETGFIKATGKEKRWGAGGGKKRWWEGRKEGEEKKSWGRELARQKLDIYSLVQIWQPITLSPIVHIGGMSLCPDLTQKLMGWGKVVRGPQWKSRKKRQNRYHAVGKNKEIRKIIKIQENKEGNSEKNHFKRESVY